MIRHPLHSAAGRTKAGLARVSDGIAASLRAFSTAQQLAAPQDDNNGDGFRPTGKQRSAAAFAEIASLTGGGYNNNSISRSPSRGGGGREGGGGGAGPSSGFRTLDLGPRGSNTGPGPTPFSGSPRRPPPRALDLRSAGVSPASFDNNIISRPAGLTGPPRDLPLGGEGRIIRAPPGGFRGRINTLRGGGGGGGMMGRGGREGGGGRGRGRGGRGGGGGRGSRNSANEDEEGTTTEMDLAGEDSPEVIARREAAAMGETHIFQPSLSKSDLAGWGAAVPVSKSTFAHDETVLRQARVIGGGQPFHPLNLMNTQELREMYNRGHGTFLASQEVKDWSLKALRLGRFHPVPKETKDAVLQDALLGTYDGPQYAELNDTLAVVQNYVKRDASWNADAGRRIEAKIKSLLPGGGATPAPAPTRAKA